MVRVREEKPSRRFVSDSSDLCPDCGKAAHTPNEKTIAAIEAAMRGEVYGPFETAEDAIASALAAPDDEDLQLDSSPRRSRSI